MDNLHLLKMEKSLSLMDTIFVLFLFCSQLRLSSVSVVFDSNVSLNDFALLSLMSFPVDFMRMEKSVLLIDAVCVLFLLSSPYKLSSVSVVFKFSASLNDAAPV